MKIIFPFIFFLFSILSFAQKTPYYKAKFEPKEKIIHGAGQAYIADFQEYTQTLTSATKPVLFMDYMGLNSRSIAADVQKIQRKVESFDWYVIPQIGLSMTNDGQPEKHYEQHVAAGDYDAQIDTMLLGLQAMNRPVFLRIGYEFNGFWNGYQPETFRQAFQRIKKRINELKINNIATVWCYGPDNDKDVYEPYYPGDEYVDWWGIDVFKPESFTQYRTPEFLADARAHCKPVMIGESTPKYVGVLDGEKSWERWFAPYFKLMADNPHVKAFCYINWNWAKFDYWKDWGDGRIGQNEIVKTRYQNAIKGKRFFHGTTEKTTKRILNIQP